MREPYFQKVYNSKNHSFVDLPFKNPINQHKLHGIHKLMNIKLKNTMRKKKRKSKLTKIIYDNKANTTNEKNFDPIIKNKLIITSEYNNIQKEYKPSPLLRVDKVETFISVLNHEHMLQTCENEHKNYEVYVDVILNEERLQFIRDQQEKLNLDISKFLYLRQLIDKKMPILSLEETKTFFAKIMEKYLSQLTKQLDIKIFLECCGEKHILTKCISHIPANIAAKDTLRINVPLLNLPKRKEDGSYDYSVEQIKTDLKVLVCGNNN